MAEPIVVETTVSEVTFFEDRAEVVRVVTCRVPAGRSRIHATGLTLLVDDRSLVCRQGHGVEVVFTRVRRSVVDEQAATASEVVAIEAEVASAETRAAKAWRAIAGATIDAERTNAMIQLWGQTAAAVPSRAEAAVEELGRAYDALDRAAMSRLDAFASLRRERDDAQTELLRAEQRLQQARTKKPRFDALAEIELVVKAETDVRLEIVYRTPCAVWRPEHLARLTRNEDGTGEITLTTYAAVWQITGETWTDVPCRFSTARPAANASAPLLADDVLTTRKKSDHERKHVVVEARDQAITVAGNRRGTRDVDEMPGVDDGGEVQWLVGKAPTTIESSGLPVRVEVDQRTFPCSVARVCFPEVGPATHIRAVATLPGPLPLLAGPVTVGRATELVGRSRVDFVAPGEPFELGFGVDDGVRVRRRVVDKRKTTQLTGTQHLAREVHLYVSNLSGETREVEVVERVPVSEVEDVVIEVERQAQMRFDGKDGFVTFALALPAAASRDVVLRYRIEAKANVVLPDLDG